MSGLMKLLPKFGRRLSYTSLYFRPFPLLSPTSFSKDFDTFGTWDNRIEKLPILVEESIKKGKLIPEISIDLVGTASLQGRSKHQEDRYVVKELDKGGLSKRNGIQGVLNCLPFKLLSDFPHQ